MRTPTVSLLVLATALATLAPVQAGAQEVLSLAPTFQQSVAAYEFGTPDPLLGQDDFHAWGFMVGLKRPNRFWQPHLWYQRYTFGQPCATPSEVTDCRVDGWSLSVGPGLEIFQTPRFAGLVLPQVGFQGRGRGLTGGLGLHVGVKLGLLRPTGFARYQVIRGAHYATLGAGLVLDLRLER